MRDDRLADGVDIAAGGEVHDRVRAEFDRCIELLDFLFGRAGDRRVADVGVDLTASKRRQCTSVRASFQVFDVCGNDHPATRDLVADRVRQRGLPDVATYSISGVMVPCRADSICVMVILTASEK